MKMTRNKAYHSFQYRDLNAVVRFGATGNPPAGPVGFPQYVQAMRRRRARFG